MKFILLLVFYFVSLHHAVISDYFVITLPITHNQPTNQPKSQTVFNDTICNSECTAGLLNPQLMANMVPTTVLCYPFNPQLTGNTLPTIVLCYPLKSQLTSNMLPTTVLCYPLNPQLTGNMLPTIVLCYPLKPQLTGNMLLTTVLC